MIEKNISFPDTREDLIIESIVQIEKIFIENNTDDLDIAEECVETALTMLRELKNSISNQNYVLLPEIDINVQNEIKGTIKSEKSRGNPLFIS
jgi:translation initiation factor 2 gamma subunit (eIF-2gamma)